MTQTVPLPQLLRLAVDVLVAAGTRDDNAELTARALVAADADGLASHGIARLPAYADQVRSGKVNGQARPKITRPRAALVRVDADYGFAFPAVKQGLDVALAALNETGVQAVGVTRSHHFGAAGYHVEQMATAGSGCLALAFSNSPAAMAPWGGSRGSFGTNPVAFACPRDGDKPPLVIDLSLSQVARGKVMLAAQRGETIPATWALDANGRPTQDPQAALAGTMMPLGGAKGAALALMVEILSAALTGSNLAFEASSFFTPDGAPPAIGHLLIAIDSTAFTSGFSDRLETLLSDMLGQQGVRLPGERRLQNRARAAAEGIAVPLELLQTLRARAAR